MFALAVGTVLSFLAVIVWTLGFAITSVVAGRGISSSLYFWMPQFLIWLATILPLLLGVEVLAFLLFSRRRWSGIPHPVRWQVIPNHNIVVAMTAYNDEASIGEAVLEFRSQPDVKAVVVVDNNSSDRTAELASSAGARVVHEQNQGYGYACMRGLKESLQDREANVVVLVEGDMTFAGRDISKLVPYLDNVDMVVGTRTTQELVAEDSQMNWFFVWGNLFLAKMIQVKFFDVKHWGRVRLTDVGCTFRAIRTEALAKIIDKLDVGGHHFSPHMMMVAMAEGMKLVEIPVTFRKRWGISKGAGASKKIGFLVGLRMMWHILSF
jgi:glycosyltransferase involved in cell wall biosynthesis